ncbi:MAG TPA: hypothetical protein VFB67_11735 [Candidatus Polarisedimenticolaceae bacterium]|nr:hypothetical protein [Candidatus Polarisedimenticolaceae bacterium]
MRPLPPPRVFARRLLGSGAIGLCLVALSLAGGMAGYHGLEGLPWIDAFLNASMILSGMGPLFEPQTGPGKLFAGAYALYSGLAVLVIAGVMLAPVIHRFLHRFHLEAGDE